MDTKEVEGKYLPIGSVVMLNGGKKRVMVTGFCAIANENPNKIYDYSGCIYPEGYISSNQVCLFDHNQIETVFYKGFVDDEEIKFKEKLVDLLSKVDVNKVLEEKANKTENIDYDNILKNEPVSGNVPSGSEIPDMPE